MLQFYYRHKLILPFIYNITQQQAKKNLVFYQERDKEGFYLLLCSKNQLFEISYDAGSKRVAYSSMALSEKNILQWDNYKEKLNKIKREAESIYVEAIVLYLSENIAQLSKIYNLSFSQITQILGFFFREDALPATRIEFDRDFNEQHTWID